jgi:hypothetical protein
MCWFEIHIFVNNCNSFSSKVAQAIVGLFVLSLALVCRVSLFVPVLPYFNILVRKRNYNK